MFIFIITNCILSTSSCLCSVLSFLAEIRGSSHSNSAKLKSVHWLEGSGDSVLEVESGLLFLKLCRFCLMTGFIAMFSFSQFFASDLKVSNSGLFLIRLSKYMMSYRQLLLQIDDIDFQKFQNKIRILILKY